MENCYYFQFTLQAILVTDGEASFATFIYDNLPIILSNVTAQERGTIGFDAGDQSTGDTVSYGEENVMLSEINIFRIDGNYSIFRSTIIIMHAP